MDELEGRVALVAGANRGIGFEVARQLAAAGATVLVTGRSAASALEAADQLADVGDVRAVPLAVDVTDASAVAALAAHVDADPGRLDILVNNAAAFVDWGETAVGADLDGARAVLETNLFGAWRVTVALLPLLQASAHPRIVNVSSGAGSHGDDQFGLATRRGAAASYGVSKAAQNALTATLAAQLADTGVLVNAVCPGLTATWPGAEAMGARPVADGAASVLWGCRLDDDGPSGGFFRDGQPLPW